MFAPSYYRRCQCKESATDSTGKPILNDDGTAKMKDIGLSCSRLGQKGHGSWYFYFELEPGENGKRRRVRRGGFTTKDDAKTEAAQLYRDADRGTDVLSNETFGEYLVRWIKGKKSLARTTRHGYEEHITNYLVPHLGHIKRRDLRVHHLDRMYDAIDKENVKRLLHHARVVELTEARDAAKTTWIKAAGLQEQRRAARRAYLAANTALREGAKGLRKITGPATQHRINDTLSSALSDAVDKELITKNWATLVELPPAKRPKPLVWTDERVEEWRRTGERPSPVMVWTPEQTGKFLDEMLADRLYPLWHSFVFFGFRRGESCALPWSEVNLNGGWVRISAQTVEVAYKTYGEDPKADSVRTIAASTESVSVLREWQEEQDGERKKWKKHEARVESGRVFTQENGDAYHPDWISRRFKRIVGVLGLPPIRLHDLRHGSATLSLLAGTDIKVVQERLGHSSRQITSDTYTSVLPQLMRSEAESTISIVPRADRDKKMRAPKPTPAVDEDPTTTDAGATASPADGPDEGKSQAA